MSNFNASMAAETTEMNASNGRYMEFFLFVFGVCIGIVSIVRNGIINNYPVNSIYDFIINENTTIITAACYGICWYIFHKSRKRREKDEIDNGAQNVTTIGLLGTFLGITISLMLFDGDANNLVNNVSNFLSGMKTAFYTSLIGIFFSLIIKHYNREKSKELSKKENDDDDEKIEILRSAIVSQGEGRNELVNKLNIVAESLQKTSGSEFGYSVEKLSNAIKGISFSINEQKTMQEALMSSMKMQASALFELKDNLITCNEEQNISLKEMCKSMKIVEENSNKNLDNSNSTIRDTIDFHEKQNAFANEQVQKLNDNTVQITEMKESFNKFLETMAENNNKAFINALKEAIENLNSKLTAQLGDNFKELNLAVGELNSWQKENKDQIIALTDSFEKCNTEFKQASTIFESLGGPLNTLKNTVSEFKDSNEKNVAVQTELTQTIIKIQDLNKNFVEHFNRINELINRNFEHFKNYTESITNAANKTVENFGEAVSQSIENNIKNVNDFSKAIENTVIKNNERLMTIEKASEQFSETLNMSGKSIGDQVESLTVMWQQNMIELRDKIIKEYNELAKTSGEAQEEAIQNLGAALGKITEKMTVNYAELANKIEQLDRALCSIKGGEA